MPPVGLYPPPTQQPRHAPDGDRRKSPERATGHRTSPSAHACPTPHCGKTPSHPAPHTSARTPTSRVRAAARGTRPTHAAHPLRQAPPPRTHAAAQTPAAHPRRTCAPCTQERPEHTRPYAPSRSPETRFSAYVSRARNSGNKIAASAHGMGSGGLAVDTMAIGCLGVDHRLKLFFVLSHFRRKYLANSVSFSRSRGMSRVKDT